MFPLRKQKYTVLNIVTIDSKAIRENYKTLQQFHPESSIAPVLKSNAYGHGLEQVAPIFDTLNAPFLVVDSLFEAYLLYKKKVKTPILVLGYTAPENFKTKKLPFHFAVYDVKVAEALSEYQPGAKIHIFVDTGMTREGVLLSELRSFIRQIKKLNLEVVGLASHFADAGNPVQKTFATYQILQYKKALKILQDEGINPTWKHISASAGSFINKDPTFNLIRAGLASYGISPLEDADVQNKNMVLHPSLTFSSTLIQVKTVPAGSKIGYVCTYTSKKPMTIGIIAAGYYEGVDRRLSNTGVVKIRNTYCKIIGRVSMNMTTIDLTDVKNPVVGERVIVYNADKKDKNYIVNVANTVKTIPYELIVHIAESVRREII